MGKKQSLENQYDRTGVALIIYCFAPVDVGVVRAGFFSSIRLVRLENTQLIVPVLFLRLKADLVKRSNGFLTE